MTLLIEVNDKEVIIQIDGLEERIYKRIDVLDRKF